MQTRKSGLRRHVYTHASVRDTRDFLSKADWRNEARPRNPQYVDSEHSQLVRPKKWTTLYEGERKTANNRRWHQRKYNATRGGIVPVQ